MPGSASTAYQYNSMGELVGAGPSLYSYDAAGDFTGLASGATQAFDADGDVCWAGTGSGTCSSPPAGATTYT